MITLNDKQYIESKNIRVFPCAYRGYYEVVGKEMVDGVETDKIETLVFDPEARATTEANFTSTFHKLSNNKNSYVVAWVPGTDPKYPNAGTLKCVIGGYYFEIYSHEMSNFFYFEGSETKPYYLCIKTGQISLGTSEPDTTDARTTEVLSSFADSTNYLDVYDDTLKQYAFTGLLISKTTGGDETASLAPFIAVPNDAEGYDYKVDPAKLPITNLLDVGSGNYSLRMINDITDHGTTNTVASGDYSVALGLSTAATGKASTALGNSTEASAEGAFAAGIDTVASNEGAVALGSDTTASGKNSIALGSNTKAEAENQVVIGKYNEKDDNQVFIIANGSATVSSNKFIVSYDGDVKAQGALEVKGDITATGVSNNLILGTSKANGPYGSITVYGKNTAPVFKVTNTGKTTIEGAIDVTGASALKNTLAVVGETTLQNGLSVTNGVTIGTGNLDVTTGNTTLGGDLTINGDVTLAAAQADATSTTNTLTLGSTAANISGALDIYGRDTNKVFEVTDAGNTTIGGTVTAKGATELKNTLSVAGATTLAGDLTVTGLSNLTITGDTSLVKTTISGVTMITQAADVEGDNAALVVSGGTKIAKKLDVTGATTLKSTLSVAETTTLSKDVSITSETDYTSANSAALKVSGGVYVGKKLHVAQQMSLANNLEVTAEKVAIKAVTESSTANNGALVVAGGVGIGKNLNVTGNTNISGNVTIASTSSSQPNSLTIGNESTSNKGGQLLIYGSGTTTVFEVDKNGNATATGNLTLGGDLSIGNKLSISNDFEISKAGIKGLKSLDVAGQINATVFNALSDARLKTNIEEYTFKKSILDLPIKQFEYINDKTHTKYVGCIAQDLQHICPDLVNEDMEGMLSIQESKLIYALLQEVKELRDRVELLERR